MYKTLDVVLDTERQNVSSSSHIRMFAANTNDYESIKVLAKITQDKRPVDLSGAEVKLAIRKPDRTVIYQSGSIKEQAGECEFVLETQSHSVPGNHVAEVMIYFADGKIVVTRPFAYQVADGLLNDKAVLSTSWYSDLETLRQAVDELNDEIDAAVIDVTAATQAATEATETANLAAQNAKESMIDFKSPVATITELNALSNPQKGDARMVRSEGKGYKFDGSQWGEIFDYNLTPLNEVDNRLTSQLAETMKVINVKSFGAKGDGVTDDSNAVQAAVDSISSNAIIVFNGIHLISKEISIQNKRNITLIGWGSVIKKHTTWSGQESTIFSVTNCTNITFDGVEFDGQNVAFPSASHEWTIIFKTGVLNAAVQKCAFKDFPRANLYAAIGFIGQTTSSRNKVLHNDFSNLGGGSIFVQARRTTISHNTIKGNGDVPIALNSPNAVECIVTHNTIEDTGKYYAIAVEDGPSNYDISHNQVINSNGIVQHLTQSYTTTVRGGSIKNNRLVGTPDVAYAGLEAVQGIFLNQYYTDVEIDDNTFIGLLDKGSESSCIYLSGAIRPLVKNNVFDSLIGNVKNGVTLVGTCVRPLISNNRFMNLTRGVFNSSATTEDLRVENNDFHNFDSGTEAVRSTVGTVKDNSFYGFSGTEYAGFPFGAVFGPSNRNKPHVMSTVEQTIFYRNAAPTSGTWKNGDRILNTALVAIGSISEWYYVAGAWVPRQIGILAGGGTLPTPGYVGEMIRQSGVIYIAVGTASNADWRQITN